jgi:AraC family transcriptional regulator
MQDTIASHLLKTLAGCSSEGGLMLELVEKPPYPVQVFAPDGLMLMINPAFIREFQISDATALIGKYNVLSDETLFQFSAQDNILNAFAGKPTYAEDFRIPLRVIKKHLDLPKDSIEAIYADTAAIPLKDALGQIICVFVIIVPRRIDMGRMEANQAKQYLEEHWREDFDIQALAKAVHLSPAYFSRLFKDNTGMTPHEYYLNCKLSRLRDLLANSNLTITEAFEACGLHYHSHYAKLFKKQTGYNPSQYRSYGGAPRDEKA